MVGGDERDLILFLWLEIYIELVLHLLIEAFVDQLIFW